MTNDDKIGNIPLERLGSDRSMKRVLLPTVATLLMLGLAVLAVAIQIRNQRTEQCLKYLILFQHGKEILRVKHHATNGTVFAWKDIFAYMCDMPEEHYRVGPPCPSGGRYTLNPIGTPPACSIPGHQKAWMKFLKEQKTFEVQNEGVTP